VVIVVYDLRDPDAWQAARRHRDMHLLHRPDPLLLQGPGVAMVGLRGFILTPRRRPPPRKANKS
jgi:hypothetical protein